ncbi:MAG: hypothetical protein B6242_02295 [Anaerolineaceae bacterium 4572_78]|nr:MAG: hypothetical protein B6242_02295 [Anaerolineaceae bacterium 4572_78]
MKQTIIDKDKSYTFSDYFKLDPPIDELLDYFGYSRQVEKYDFPKSTIDIQAFVGLKTLLEDSLRHVDLNTEIARRETLIAPVLVRLAIYLNIQLRVEYPMKVNHQLKGKIDYFMQRKHNVLIVEAKRGDLQRGFTQLSVELIAMDKWLDDDEKPIYGTVTMGNAWQFSVLNRQTKVITQDMNLYPIPKSLDELLTILLTIL